MFEEWLSKIYYCNRNNIALLDNLMITNNTTYEAFVNQLLVDTLNRNGYLQNQSIDIVNPSEQHEKLHDIYLKNFDTLVKNETLKLIAEDTTFDEFESLLVYDFFLQSDCIYTPLTANSIVTVNHCLKDEQINVAAMTLGIPNGKETFYQTIICKNTNQCPVGNIYILVPKVTGSTEFQKSIAGINFQTMINKNYGFELECFKNNYIAQSVTNYPIHNLNDLEILCKDIFPLWEAKGGPYEHINEHNSDLVAFRVYKITENLVGHIKNPRSRRPAINNGSVRVNILQPVLDDKRFRYQQVKLLKLLMH